MDIVERLREDKLDALAAVESENDFYQMEIERLRDEVHFDDQTIKSLSEINDRLQKKNELLREALLDLEQYVSRADHFYLKPETLAVLKEVE